MLKVWLGGACLHAFCLLGWEVKTRKNETSHDSHPFAPHPFPPAKQTRNNTMWTCKPWHIYLLACCWSERHKIWTGRNVAVLPLRRLHRLRRSGWLGWMNARGLASPAACDDALLSLVFRLPKYTVAMPTSTPSYLLMHA